MAKEFEYAVETRYRVNLVDDATAARPMEPNWSEWSDWTPRASYRTYPTLAGAAMACGFMNTGISREYREPRAPYQETQARVSYRKVPKGWIPLLPELGDGE